MTIIAHSLREAILRHRVGLAEAAFLLACIGGAATLALTFDLSGQVSGGARIELGELLGLGVVVVVSFSVFAWRRFREQSREISRRIAAEEQARFLAHHDHLTGLPNRRQLQQALIAATHIAPSAEQSHAIFLLDLNGVLHAVMELANDCVLQL